MKKVRLTKTGNLVVIVLIAILTSISLTSFAKYIDEIESTHEQATSNFYFTSNYLSIDNLIYEIYTNQIDIELYNYNFLNIEDVTTETIHYDTSIKYYDETNSLVGTEIITTDNSSWTVDNHGQKSTLQLNSVVGSSYALVSVSSTSPYVKTMGARFNFNSTEYVPMYNVNRLTNGFTVEVMTANEDMSSVSITWPTSCGPDNTNPNMSSWTTGGNSNYLTNLKANTTYSLNFYCALEVTNVVEVADHILDTGAITISLE